VTTPPTSTTPPSTAPPVTGVITAPVEVSNSGNGPLWHWPAGHPLHGHHHGGGQLIDLTTDIR
jgi:hypothetical protein